MAKKAVIQLVATGCPPETEQKFNDWVNNKHMPELLKTGKIHRVTRSKKLLPEAEYPQYLVIYEFNSVEDFNAFSASPELAAGVADWKAVQKEFGATEDWLVQYEIINNWE